MRNYPSSSSYPGKRMMRLLLNYLGHSGKILSPSTNTWAIWHVFFSAAYKCVPVASAIASPHPSLYNTTSSFKERLLKSISRWQDGGLKIWNFPSQCALILRIYWMKKKSSVNTEDVVAPDLWNGHHHKNTLWQGDGRRAFLRWPYGFADLTNLRDQRKSLTSRY